MILRKKLKQKKNKIKPNLGDIRLIKKFAILPIRISEDELMWLQFYKQRQTYSELFEYFFDSCAGTIGQKTYNKWVNDYDNGYPVVLY